MEIITYWNGGHPLTLADRRIYNLLIETAWESSDRPIEHSIPKQALRGSHNVNYRVGQSIERLMAAIVKIWVIRDGKEEIERVQLLGGNTEPALADGIVRYEFPSKLRRIIKNSTIFARLQKEVMLALSSKYALALYEMVQKRMQHAPEFRRDLPFRAWGSLEASSPPGAISITGR